ncbi:MAG: FmdB family zinc ribbon protein [Solirubrobacteraceae bacterium]
MPIYEYRCKKGHAFEVRASFTDGPVTECEVCGQPVERVFHPIAVHFKGSGFYNTDYGTRNRSREKEAAQESSKSESSSSDNGKSESSSKSASDSKPAKSESGGGKSESGTKSESGSKKADSSPAKSS